jgi:heme/copper-type cytochrome/quinol oxidase subunit 2
MVWLLVVLVLVVFISSKVVSRAVGVLRPDSETLEQVWTVIPIIILLTIAIPSIQLLCLQDSRNQVIGNTVKTIRNQWNWQRESREVVDHLLDSERLDVLASFERPLVLTRGTLTRVLTIRTDVLHSLGIPSLGIKLDASPGRIRMTSVEPLTPGLFLGSCYELCGRGHRAMPINILCI